MARNPQSQTSKARAPKAKVAKPAEPADAIIDATLDLAAIQGWRDTTLGDIARHAGVSLAELYGHFPSKMAILAAFARRIDLAMLAGIEPEEAEETPRERLFDLAMRRFDALAPHREGIRAILRDSGRDPATALCGAAGPFRRTLTWMLEAAGLDSSGLTGMVRANGLALIYLSVLRVWLEDESEDMSKTMAVLDKRLKRAEELVNSLPGRRRRGAREAAEAVP